jgi:pimeloyl-ACP methyl ester carboxylesterase
MKTVIHTPHSSFEIYAYTGGKAFRPEQPTAIFIHGVLGDHSVWILQSRYLAHHGWNVLAIDLPGHARSAGNAPESVEEAAEAIMALIEGMQLTSAALIGHSWGSLIALQAASQLKDRVSHLILIGTAFPMVVSESLLQTSLTQPEQALEMINVFSRATLAPVPSSMGPGTWVYGASKALGRRVLASNRDVNVFHRGFVACNNYQNGRQAICEITCPALFILGERDQMTPPKAAQKLIQWGREAGQAIQVITTPTGHHQMTESPEETLAAILQFLPSQR